MREPQYSENYKVGQIVTQVTFKVTTTLYSHAPLNVLQIA